jgi:hypothetical protein
MVTFETENDPNLKVMHIDGVYGFLNTNGGSLAFFIEIPKLEIKDDGQAIVNVVKRTFLMDIRMSTENYKSIAEWMINNVKNYEKIRESGVKPPETQTYYQ